jgi:hypothetical protein
MAVPDCCSEPLVKEQSHWNEGERVEIYAKCKTCGAKWKDVFTHSHSTRRDDQ